MNLVDYHNHTELCGHAVGSVDDYINAAVRAGLADIGFSDHAPLPEGLRQGITMYPSQTEEYIDLIEQKRNAYKDRINVKVGFEVDFPLTGAFDKKYLGDARLDYLIGSCHYIGDWAFDHQDNISEFDRRDIDKVYDKYYGIIEKLTAANTFNIIGHFDLVKKFGHRSKSDFTGKINSLAKLIATARNLAVEVNTAGLRKPVKEIYPSKPIIEMLFKNNVPLTLGSDSHNPEEVAFHFDDAIAMIKKVGYRKISGFARRQRYDISL